MYRTAVADLSSTAQATAIVSLLNEYAMEIMGGGKPLAEPTQANLIPALQSRRDACVILAWADEQPAGLTIAFEGFSTFACKPTLNIHDLYVAVPHRGQGLARLLLRHVESLAIERGCCKLTLEVLEGNHPARQAYHRFGFTGYELDPTMGHALFLEKKLSTVDRTVSPNP